MRLVLIVLLACCRFVAAEPLGERDARHLLARTGFGPTSDEVASYARLDRAAAVDKLLAETRRKAVTTPPVWVNEPAPVRRYQDLSEVEKKAARELQRDRGVQLRAWWYDEIRDTPSPLTERMVLFWHNHFVSSLQKVRQPQWLYQQNVQFREHALGNFAELLHDAIKAPAMLVYLDAIQNRKGQPNENLAREVMELFTLGEGNYSEQDIREAARALTGMSLDRDTGAYRFRLAQHDFGEKTIFGQRGNYDPDAFLERLLARPETAEFITRKLWLEFVSPEPDARELKRLARVFRQHRYEIKPLMRALLVSDAFYAEANRGVLVKSPVELTLGTFRQFGITPPDWRTTMAVNRGLGQDLFNPPNVKGWPGYTDWINSQTLLTRKQLLARIFRAAESADVAAMAGADRSDRASLRLSRRAQDLHLDDWVAQAGGLGRASLLLLPLEPEADSTMMTASPAEAISRLVLDPLFQLK
ncbi:DUF1800 family protein [Chitinimonas sp. BJYL2]|uniref:DUF1800 domain-containing protein n=1 Tax=Chitinimonas sp. BJYL2 TaxID=2976696 RepID=UPI0022B456D6|nr:DUF1800 domain-containing protein [Chitinimonas sp. BJYL2]